VAGKPGLAGEADFRTSGGPFGGSLQFGIGKGRKGSLRDPAASGSMIWQWCPKARKMKRPLGQHSLRFSERCILLRIRAHNPAMHPR